MELADRNLSVQEGRYALHILILHANEFGQELRLDADPSQVIIFYLYLQVIN
jgi:hypothetical protein